MDHMFHALGRFAVRYRYLVVVGWVPITVGSMLAFPSLASLTTDSALTTFLPATAQSVEAAQLAAPRQNTRYATATLVAIRDGGRLSAPNTTMRIDAALLNSVPAMPADSWSTSSLAAHNSPIARSREGMPSHRP